MGRHRSFDLDKAVAVATDLFWRKGYDGTSMSDLTKAIGVSAPSFYFAFGSKEGLFRRVVETYLARQNAIIEAAFAKTDTRSLVRSLLEGFGAFFADRNHAPGCLILNSSLPIDDAHPFRAEWADGRRHLREALAHRFAEDRDFGRGFPERWPPDDTARTVYCLIWGMAVEAHSGADAHQIQAMIDHFLETWPS